MAIALNIPSQIEKYLSVALFPATGNEFTLYIANDTNRLYQWNGAAYIEVSQQDAVNWGSIGGDIINQTDLQLALAGKVDVEAGKGLSTNDYTTAEKNKLAGIEAGAQVNDVDSVNGYTGAVVLSKSDVGLSNVDNTSDLNKPISTATQNALDAKVPTSRTLTINGVTQDLSANRTFTISTGITIGTTAIASGTVGRVLFQGTGNVVQQSSSLFWDNAATSLNVIGTNPSVTLNSTSSLTNFSQGFGFSKNGVGIFSFGYTESVSAPRFFIYAATTDRDAIKIYNSTANVAIGNAPSQNTDAGFRLDVNGTARVQGNTTISLNQNAATELNVSNTNNSASSQTLIRISSSSGSGLLGRYSASTTPYKTLAANDTFFYSAGTSDISLLNDFASGRIKFAAGGSSTAQMTLFSTGNFAINTTTDAGFRLDVNGTARVSGLLSLTDNNGIQFTTGFGNNAGNMISSQGSSTLLVMNRGSRVLKFWNGSGTAASQSIQIGFGIDALEPSNLASAIVQIDSTTKGFLPPRMTQAQRNAIASPAIGLEIYQTDATEGKYIYKSSGWTYIG